MHVTFGWSASGRVPSLSEDWLALSAFWLGAKAAGELSDAR
jgi:hypothetical protein